MEPLPPRSDPSPWVVTTAQRPSPGLVAEAHRVARLVGLPVVQRRGAWDPSRPAIVLTDADCRLVVPGTRQVVRSHPGMGLVRLRRLLLGEEHDPLVDISGVRPGDRVLDATFGFGQDSLILAHGVGVGGRVDAVEKSPVLAALALGGLPHWPEPAPALASRIHLRPADALDWLRSVADGHYDGIYWDPMFRTPKASAPDFQVLRSLAWMAPFDQDTLSLARRKARRWVVVKEAAPGTALQALGCERLWSRRGAEVVFGLWTAVGG